jgi:hypothetical protein
MLSDDGTIWLNEASRAANSRWIRLDADGNARGAVFLPRRAQILFAEWDRLWILERDQAGVPAVVRYRVR